MNAKISMSLAARGRSLAQLLQVLTVVNRRAKASVAVICPLHDVLRISQQNNFGWRSYSAPRSPWTSARRVAYSRYLNMAV